MIKIAQFSVLDLDFSVSNQNPGLGAKQYANLFITVKLRFIPHRELF